jgi:hypothetical protein
MTAEDIQRVAKKHLVAERMRLSSSATRTSSSRGSRRSASDRLWCQPADVTAGATAPNAVKNP